MDSSEKIAIIKYIFKYVYYQIFLEEKKIKKNKFDLFLHN